MRVWPWMAAGIFVWAGLGPVEGAASPSPAAAVPAATVADLLEQAEALQSSEPERALAIAQTARDQATNEADRLNAQVKMASFQRLLTNYVAAIELAERGLARATELGDAKLMAHFRYVLARTQWNLGNYQVSLELYLAALRQAEEIGDDALAFDAHSGISTIFGDFKQPEQATFHLEQARLIVEKLNDPMRLGDLHKIVGNNAIGRKDFARGLAEHQKSLEVHQAAGNERGVADALQNLGYANEQLGNLPLALEQTRQSIAIYQRLGLRRHLVNAMRQSGRLLVKLGLAEEGVKELEATLTLTLQLKALSLLAYNYRELARAYEAQGNFTEAYKAQQKLISTNEAVFTERSSQQLAILNSRYIQERKQMEIDLLRRDQALKDAELARSRAERLWLLAVASVGLVALAAMVSRQRLKLKAEQRVVAESRAAKEAAEKADRLKTRLLGIASHDLKNPVAAVMGGLTELSEAVPRERELIRGLLSESERMLALIHDLLDQAALESGQLRLSVGSVDLTALVREVAASHRTRAEAKGIALVANLASASTEACVVPGDPVRLRQVLVNLVDNALKFTPVRGAVTLGLARSGENVEMSVADTGPGMTDEDKANLFTPFAALSAKPTGGENSTGLGLSICHELVTLHGGRIEVRTVLGAGTVFAVILPRR